MHAKYITPSVTPLNEDRSLDLPALREHLDRILSAGVDGVLILGSIGEFFGLDIETKKTLITESVKFVNGRVPVMAGISGTVIREILDLGHFALDVGADSVICVPPYYFKLEQKDIFTFYSRIAQEITVSVYLYNFPDRCGYSIDPETVLRLKQEHPNIKGIKDTLAGVDHTREIIKTLKPLYPDFEVYSGFDDNFAHNALSGGDGCIAGLSNLVPEITTAWCTAVNDGNSNQIALLQQKIDRLMDIYSIGNPFVPYIKAALSLTGSSIKPYSTFPLPEVSKNDLEKIRIILEKG